MIPIIVSLAHAAEWIFTRLSEDGRPSHVVVSSEPAKLQAIHELSRELDRQRATRPHGAIVAPRLGSCTPYEYGVTIVFADEHADYGMLTLLRRAADGPFTRTEMRLLELAVEPASELLCGARFIDDESNEMGDSITRKSPLMYVLDLDLKVTASWVPVRRRTDSERDGDESLEGRLPPILENAVRELIGSWVEGTPTEGIAYPAPFIVLRTQPLRSESGLAVGVLVERFRRANSLAAVARHFAISPREMQILALLLGGAKTPEIAQMLNISISTVRDHVKKLLQKTGSRSRSETVAKVLNFEAG